MSWFPKGPPGGWKRATSRLMAEHADPSCRLCGAPPGFACVTRKGADYGCAHAERLREACDWKRRDADSDVQWQKHCSENPRMVAAIHVNSALEVVSLDELLDVIAEERAEEIDRDDRPIGESPISTPSDAELQIIQRAANGLAGLDRGMRGLRTKRLHDLMDALHRKLVPTPEALDRLLLRYQNDRLSWGRVVRIGGDKWVLFTPQMDGQTPAGAPF